VSTTTVEKIDFLQNVGMNKAQIGEFLGMSTDEIDELFPPAPQPLEPIDIYIVWDMQADSWSGSRFVKSMHQTLEGAEASIPASIKQAPYIREPDDTYIKNYTYVAIEKRPIGA
jgi:hypothetical protein